MNSADQGAKVVDADRAGGEAARPSTSNVLVRLLRSEESRDVVVAFGDAAALPVPWMMARTGQRLRCDVLVDVEEIAGIVRPLELNQAVVVLAVVVSNPAEIVVLHEVDVAAGLRIRRQCLVVVA